MPQYNLIDQDNIALGDCKLLLPVSNANNPLQNMGKLENVNLTVEGTTVELKTQMPEFTLKRYLMGQRAIISADSLEPLADSNMPLLTGGAQTDLSVWAGVALQTAYDKDADDSMVLTGDVSANISAGDYLKITEGANIEYFTAAKVTVSTNTTVALALYDRLLNDYTTSAVVSKIAGKQTGFGKFANLSGSMGILVFEEFQPQSGGTRKVMQLYLHNLALPHSFELALASGEWIRTPVEFEALADPTKANGALLGYFRVFDAAV